MDYLHYLHYTRRMPRSIVPPSTETAQRWIRSALRRRLLEGVWEDDLIEHLGNHLDPAKQEAWGRPTLALNLYKSTMVQLACLYKQDPIVRNDDLDDTQQAYLDSIDVFRHHQDMQRLCLGMGECAIKVEWSPGNQVSRGGIQLRVVSADRIDAKDDPRAPGIPVMIAEAVRRVDPSSKDREVKWFWEAYSIENPAAPFFAILTGDERRADVTQMFMPPEQAEWRWFDTETGEPYLPWTLYHAEDKACLFNPGVWKELAEGTLDVGMLASYLLHGVKDASWVQKFGLDVDLQGSNKSGHGTGQRSEISTDPASILLFRSKQGSGSLGSFAQAIDPRAIIETLRDYVAMIASNVGFLPSDLEKKDRESGISIQIRRDAVRRYQQQFTDTFRRGDTALLRLVAQVSNGFSGPEVPALPTDGYQVMYPAIPRTREELQMQFDLRRTEFEMGLVSRVDMIMEREPGLSREDAANRLRQIDEDNRLFPVAAAPAQSAPAF